MLHITIKKWKQNGIINDAFSICDGATLDEPRWCEWNLHLEQTVCNKKDAKWNRSTILNNICFWKMFLLGCVLCTIPSTYGAQQPEVIVHDKKLMIKKRPINFLWEAPNYIASESIFDDHFAWYIIVPRQEKQLKIDRFSDHHINEQTGTGMWNIPLPR